MLQVLVVSAAPAQTFNLLYSFKCGADGAVPYDAPLFHDGRLYGTTFQAGTGGLGVVYQLDIKTGQQTVLHSFQGGSSDGANPYAGVIRDPEGNLYGATIKGGAYGLGGVFQLQPSGALRFSSLQIQNGGVPDGTLVRGPAGRVYGTAYFYGAHDRGTIFEIDPAGHISTLLSFDSYDGAGPLYGAMILRDGRLYGSTYYGGKYAGVIYNYDLTTLKETVMYDFTPAADSPQGGLAMDGAGNIYGTTTVYTCTPPQCGTVFKLDTSGNYTTLHSFTGGADGWDPLGGLVVDSQNNVYGATYYGGYVASGTCYDGCGTIFRIDPAGTLTNLHTFQGTDGVGLFSGVAMGPDGNLYGASEGGGANGCGTVFSVKP
jgi:uncharacterized repeat protein (TIGR03803 family)